MSGIGDQVRDVVRDIALLVFDRAVARARAQFPSAERLLVTREDLVAAVLELRYEQLTLVVSQLDASRAEFERAAAEQQARIAREWEADHFDVEIVPPDGTEPLTQPFKKKS